MPLASKETVDRVAHVLLNGTNPMKRAVLLETPIAPPHGTASMFSADQLNNALHNFTKLKITSNDHMICFLKFKAVESVEVGALTFETKFPSELPTVAERAGWVPCWFLPWASARIIKLKIPSVAGSPQIAFAGAGIDPVDNPSLFFTAAINGCSVFAVGAADAPSMYHGGINPGSGLVMQRNPNETTEAAWRRLLGRAATAKFVGSVGKTDYVAELNDPAGTDDSDRVRNVGGVTTRRADVLERQLQANGRLTRVTLAPWGAVFGLRDPGTGNWRMTLVQNCTVSYQRVVVTVVKRFMRSSKTVTTIEGEQRGDVSAPISNSYNLGHKDFFPGVGAAVQRVLDVTQIF